MTYTYLNINGLHDDELSRVSQVKDGTVVTARYHYNGAGTVMGTKYPEADVHSLRYSGSTFPDLDRFNRTIKSEWTKDYGTGTVKFFDTDVTYDRNSNVELVEDNVHGGRDVDYTIDNLNRLIKAEEGTWNGSSITSRSRQEIWTLTQTGNWDLFKLDLNGDNDFIDTNELNDDRTHNKANELTARDIDDNGTDDYTLTFDANGNLTDDGENYQYVFDAFNRLRQVKNGAKLVAEFRYNGLNHRITAQHDTNLDGVLDGSDTTLHFVYDERWRIVAVFEDDDSAPREEFIHHNAGTDGFGGSSYIDDVVFRDRDTDGNGTLEERIYYCQNWRHDVVALVNDVGELIEQVRYSPYGVPFGYPTGDTNSDGDWDAGDNLVISSSPSYDVRKDANLDGVVNSSDVTHANSITGGYQTLGRLVLTSTGVESILGYAGYVHDPGLAGSKWHVRHRVLDGELGLWLTRDPWEYVMTLSLYEYAPSNPLSWIDPYGLYPDGETGPIHVDWRQWPYPVDGNPDDYHPGNRPATPPGIDDGVGEECPKCPTDPTNPALIPFVPGRVVTPVQPPVVRPTPVRPTLPPRPVTPGWVKWGGRVTFWGAFGYWYVNEWLWVAETNAACAELAKELARPIPRIPPIDGPEDPRVPPDECRAIHGRCVGSTKPNPDPRRRPMPQDCLTCLRYCLHHGEWPDDICPQKYHYPDDGS